MNMKSADDMEEKQLAWALQSILENENKTATLKEYDRHHLLTEPNQTPEKMMIY